MSENDPHVWSGRALQEGFVNLADAVLHQCIRPLIGVCCAPGHHGYQRAFELISLWAETRYATLIHELAHLYCGNLGTPNGRWWPDRQNLSDAVREFEAESVSYLVCARIGIDTASEEYLAAYVRKCPVTPSISLDRVLKSVCLLEQMGRGRLGLR